MQEIKIDILTLTGVLNITNKASNIHFNDTALWLMNLKHFRTELADLYNFVQIDK